ncbi:hypothetical protein HN51_063124, partial [Arachis hypogaea]
VAKALRQVAEGKAFAQAEAAEWKRKFELERLRNLQFDSTAWCLKFLEVRKRLRRRYTLFPLLGALISEELSYKVKAFLISQLLCI